MQAPPASIGRNDLCPCGSGERYKRCCGRDPVVVSWMGAALHAQLRGAVDEARDLYGRVLDRSPGLPDAMHMLGAVELAAGDTGSALPRLAAAARRLGEAWPPARGTLGLAAHTVLGFEAMVATDRRWLEALAASKRSATPVAADGRTSVVVPSYNHARYVGEAIASIVAQTRPPDEIVVVDDGSTDDSAGRLDAIAREHAGRVRLVVRGNRGAAATLNEAIAMASGEWIAILNSDDRYPPHRLETMHGAVAASGADWGFSRVDFIDADGRAIGAGVSTLADEHRRLADGVGACDTVGFAFLEGNRAITSGALHFRKSLWERVGGFADLRYNHDWDFCLRATRFAEPRFVARPSYDYRLHGANTILESHERARAEIDAMFRRWYDEDARLPPPENRYAPSSANWGELFALRAIGAGHAALLPAGTVERLAALAMTAGAP